MNCFLLVSCLFQVLMVMIRHACLSDVSLMNLVLLIRSPLDHPLKLFINLIFLCLRCLPSVPFCLIKPDVLVFVSHRRILKKIGCRCTRRFSSAVSRGTLCRLPSQLWLSGLERRSLNRKVLGSNPTNVVSNRMHVRLSHIA